MKKFVRVNVTDVLPPLLALAWLAIFQNPGAVKIYNFTLPTMALALAFTACFLVLETGWTALYFKWLRKVSPFRGSRAVVGRWTVLFPAVALAQCLLAAGVADPRFAGDPLPTVITALALGWAGGFAIRFKVAVVRQTLVWLAFFYLAQMRMPPAAFAPAAAAVALFYGGAVALLWGVGKRRGRWKGALLSLLCAAVMIFEGTLCVQAGEIHIQEMVNAPPREYKFANASFVALLPDKPVASVAFNGRDPALRDLFRELPFVESRGFASLFRRHGADVVFIEDLPRSPLRYFGMVKYGARLARDGFLVVPNRLLSIPAARQVLDEFKYSFPLAYPYGVYTVFSNRQTTLTLENFAERLASVMPESPFPPPDILGELMKYKVELDMASAPLSSSPDPAEAAPVDAPRKYLIMLPILLAVYFLVRRFIPRRATVGFENGIYAGATLGACVALPLASGMHFAEFSRFVLPLAATVLLFSLAPRRDRARGFFSFITFALAPIMFEYGWIYALICGAAFWVVRRRALYTAAFWLLFFPLDPVGAGFAASMGFVSDVLVMQRRGLRTTGAVFLLATALAVTVVFRLAELACPLWALVVGIMVLRLLTQWFAPPTEVKNG